MADLHKAEAAAREALDGTHPGNDAMEHGRAELRDLLAALDAARGEARQKVKDTLTDYLDHYPHPEFLDAVMAHFAPPAAPRVERYGDGVLVHWPEGVEQYVCVGDCVTGNLGAMAVPVGPSRDAVANAIWLATKAYGSLDHDRPSLSAEPRPLQKLIYEQADAAIIAMLAAADKENTND